MNDEEFKRLLRDVGVVFRDMEPGPECPPDEMLLDYVYNELSKAEHEKIHQHRDNCDRCRFEILKLEADRAGWEEALTEDPDAAIEHALGPDGVRRVREAMDVATSPSQPAFTSVRPPAPAYFELNQDTVDRIAAAAAAEVLDNVDLHMAYWKKTRGTQPHHDLYTGMAQASGLSGDILPFIADAINRAWEWCVRNRYDLAVGGVNSALVVHVSSIFHESKGLTGLNDKEIDVLSEKVSREVAKAVTRVSESDADG